MERARDADRLILGYREPHTQPRDPRVCRTAVVGLVVSVLTSPFLLVPLSMFFPHVRFVPDALDRAWVYFVALPLTAFVLNCVALTRAKDSKGRLRGHDLGMLGLTLSTIALAPALASLCLSGSRT